MAIKGTRRDFPGSQVAMTPRSQSREPRFDPLSGIECSQKKKTLKNKQTQQQAQGRQLYPSESHSVMSDSLQPHGLYSPWSSLGQNTGVGSCSLFQGIFPTQGSHPGLLHCRQILYELSYQGTLWRPKWEGN